MTEKQKRLRVHVVKEIFETEREYTRSLEFTVTYILEKAREKERNPHESTFTADNIQTLFCNIEEILDVHRRLMKDLEETIGSKGPSYESPVAQCYLRHKEGLQRYKKYGENNEQAQKLFYDLHEQPCFKAFFYGCMLLGGKGEEEISAYFFKPIQRVCKYPLLFRELEKYTPPGHPDFSSTQNALKMVRETCSSINEAKRRVEELEAIADWQAAVEQWEGPNVVDTCNMRIKEGSLIKISAGNTQERQFYLFDNLLVYCKKKGKGGVFRGRISVENLEIEDIQDGTADFHSNGLTVVNGWKVHNIAKDKWFVLLAKSPQEKHDWTDAIRREKEKKKRVAAGIAQATRNLMITKGDRFYNLMLDDQLIRDHRARLKTYQKSFTGQEMVKWLIQKKEAENVDEAIKLGQALIDNGLIHHVNDKHQFKNTPELLYRFRYDDKTYKGLMDSTEVTSRGIRLYCHLHGLFDPLLKDQRVGVGRTTLYCVVNAQRMIDWWCEEKDICNRAEGVTLGKELYATGIMKHATDPAQNFKDSAEFYRFMADEGHEGPKEKDRKQTLAPVPSKKNFGMVDDKPCKTFTLLYSEVDHTYGVELGSQYPVIITQVSPGAQVCGVRLGQQVLAINSNPVTSQNPTEHFRALTVESEMIDPTSPEKVRHNAPPPLYLTIVRRSSEPAVLSPKGSLGFNVKGSSPVVVSSTDRDSPAAQAGIIVSSAILKVGDQDVLHASHEEVVSAVRKALNATADSDRGSRVELKLSNPFMEHVTSYSYETSEGTTVDVYERLTESPYIFSVPSQLLKLYEEEMKVVVSLLESMEVTDSRVTEYMSGLKSISEVYGKTILALSGARWPTYKVFGNFPPVALEACATNLHTSVLDVINSGASSSVTLSSSSYEESLNGGLPLVKTHTSYCISTMAAPTVGDKRLAKDEQVKDVEIRRDLLYTLGNHLQQMRNEQAAVKKMVDELHPGVAHPMIPNGRLDIPNGDADDITPMNTPPSSPLFNRRRVVSVSNPEPIIKLMVQGVLQKVEAFLEYLEDKLLLSVAEECDGIVKITTQEMLKNYRERLKSLSEEVKVLAKKSPGEPLYRSTKILVDTVQKIVQEFSARIWISIALCDKTSLLQNVDKLFSQCLTSVVTAFGHHLVKAGRGHLNPGVEYEEDNWEASQQWLQMISKKGVLLHIQSTLNPTDAKEFSGLRDFKRVLSKVEKVKLFVKPEDKGEPSSLPLLYSELPPVKLEGDRNEVHVTFFVPQSVFKDLPEGIMASSGIRIIPILFNKGLIDIQEGPAVHSQEKSLNTESFKTLKDYYQALRRFRLDKSNLPEESDAKCMAISKISRPLNAMDLLMRQVEVAVKEPMKPGVGLLTIAAELTTRMGALRVNVCDSGVYRSSLATSLEQVMVLSRCHGLPFRSFRTTLNTIRRKGGLISLIRKNNADMSKSLPKKAPKLYQIPPEPKETS